jgi:hypothetical protein
MWHASEMRKVVWSRKLEGRLRRRREDNIKVYIEEMESEGVDWILLPQNRVHRRNFVKTVMNIETP